VPPLTLATNVAVLAFACMSFSVNYLDPYRLFAVGALIASLALLALHARYEDGAWHVEPLTLLLATIVVGALLVRIPEYAYGHSVNGLVHRSLFRRSFCSRSRCRRFARLVLRARCDAVGSRYVALPNPGTSCGVRGVWLCPDSCTLFQKGWDGLSWHAVTTAYDTQLVTAAGKASIVTEAGMRNHILGTFMLIA